MKFNLSTDEALEILKRYDPIAYEHYLNNGFFIGSTMKNYAAYLQEQHSEDKEEINR